MSAAASQNGVDLPVHPSLVLYFTGCSYTYYHTIPQQIPKRERRDPPDGETCQISVPERLDGRGVEKLMVARKAQIEGKCRQHDMELLRQTIGAENLHGEIRIDRSPRIDSMDDLSRIQIKSTTKSRAILQFLERWTVQFNDALHVHMLWESAVFPPGIGDDLTEEEQRRFPHNIGID